MCWKEYALRIIFISCQTVFLDVWMYKKGKFLIYIWIWKCFRIYPWCMNYSQSVVCFFFLLSIYHFVIISTVYFNTANKMETETLWGNEQWALGIENQYANQCSFHKVKLFRYGEKKIELLFLNWKQIFTHKIIGKPILF